MSVPGAYLVVIVIWATTPLAVKWSGEGLDPVPAAASRMLIAAAVGWLLLKWLRIPLPWHREALNSYLAAGLGIFGAMSLVYWGALYLPSGLISVLFGLSPILSGLMAQRWLNDSGLTAARWLGCVTALAGPDNGFLARAAHRGRCLDRHLPVAGRGDAVQRQHGLGETH